MVIIAIRSTDRTSFLRLALTILAVVAGTTVVTAKTAPTPTGRVVAITFDDLPYMSEKRGVLGGDVEAAVAAQHRIIRALRRNRIPATGFVNEDKVEALGPVGHQLVAEWNKGLLALGNHGYSHFDSNDRDLPEIEREMVNGEATIRPMAAAVGRAIPFFRFPYNHVGDTERKRVAIEQLLARHGYSLAASTIDTSDYLFNQAYERAFTARDPSMMKRIKQAYLDYSRVQIVYYGELDRKVVGREVPAIMLLHANRLNSETINALLGLFRSTGYRFVSLVEAQSDPVYAVPPAVATKFGPMWAYRWARERKVKVDGRLEQEPPVWLQSYADISIK